MELLSIYQKCIMNIDEIKEEELQKGLTTKCKRVINETYSKISGKEGELELELYKRKRCLLNDVKVTSSLTYDVMMSIASAFIGAFTGYTFDENILFLNSVVVALKNRTFFQGDPIEILDNGLSGFWYVIPYFIFMIVLLGWFFKSVIPRKDDLCVFKTDMGNYEIQKIDELLEKL